MKAGTDAVTQVIQRQEVWQTGSDRKSEQVSSSTEELLRAELDRRVHKKPARPQNLRHLANVLLEEWHKLPREEYY